MNGLRRLRRSRFLVTVAGVSLTVGLAVIAQAGPAAPAYASSRTQYCAGTQCLNAWNGGPAVNTFTPNVSNNDFQAINDSDNQTALQFQGSGSFFGACIGDYGNSSTDARAGLDDNCAGGVVPWGGNLQASTCPGGIEFKDLHWNGYLGPATTGNGVAFYLNKPTPYCFALTSF